MSVFIVFSSLNRGHGRRTAVACFSTREKAVNYCRENTNDYYTCGWKEMVIW